MRDLSEAVWNGKIKAGLAARAHVSPRPGFNSREAKSLEREPG